MNEEVRMFLNGVRAFARPKGVAIALALYLASGGVLQLWEGYLASLAPGVGIPDLRFGYDLATVLAIFTAYGVQGRLAYAINLVIDSVEPVLFTIATVLVSIRAAPRWAMGLSVAPLAFGALDLVENGAFAVMLVQYPDVSSGLVAVASVVTMVKLVCYAVAIPTLVVGTMVLLVRPAIAAIRPMIRARTS